MLKAARSDEVPGEAAVRGVRDATEQARSAATEPATISNRPSAGFRPDIEGLRAVAVSLVVLDHLLKQPKGGFIGVDVFFVISGFLITGLLIRERKRTGRISFADFYRRRARRILPASMLVLVVTVVASYAIFLGNRGRETLVDGVWSALFAANWHYSAIGTDYFGSSLPPSPLQHYWSLAVEEQFYVVWPILILVISALAARRIGLRRRRSHLLLGVTVVAVLAGFAWSVVATSDSKTSAYFSTGSRAWELGVGALLAIAGARIIRIPAPLRPVLAYAGLGAIAFAALTIGSGAAFPGPWAIVPVLGAAAVIAAGIGGPVSPLLWPLTNPVSRYLGKISFSLYLWHWPVVVILGSGVLPPVSGAAGKLAVAALTGAVALALSILSFHLVEDPIRHSNWLEPRARRVAPMPASDAAAAAPRRRTLKRSWQIVAAGVVLVLATGASWVSVEQGPTAAASKVVVSASAPELQRQLADGLTMTSWPTTTPSLEGLPKSGAPILRDAACINRTSESGKHCVYGSGTSGRAVLIGDSVAMSWMPGVEAALKGWTLDVYGKFGCGYTSVTVLDADGLPYRSCDEQVRAVIKAVIATKPDLVILSESWGAAPAPSVISPGETALDAWRRGVVASVTQLKASGARVVILGAPPYGTALQSCATRLRTPADCSIPVPSPAVVRGKLLGVIAEETNTTYVDTTDWFCVAGGRCPAITEGRPIRADFVHLTASYSSFLAPQLAAVLNKTTP